MKSKKIGKKLVLSKSTVAHLNDNELGKVQGGSTIYGTISIKPTRCNDDCPNPTLISATETPDCVG